MEKTYEKFLLMLNEAFNSEVRSLLQKDDLHEFGQALQQMHISAQDTNFEVISRSEFEKRKKSLNHEKYTYKQYTYICWVIPENNGFVIWNIENWKKPILLYCSKKAALYNPKFTTNASLSMISKIKNVKMILFELKDGTELKYADVLQLQYDRTVAKQFTDPLTIFQKKYQELKNKKSSYMTSLNNQLKKYGVSIDLAWIQTNDKKYLKCSIKNPNITEHFYNFAAESTESEKSPLKFTVAIYPYNFDLNKRLDLLTKKLGEMRKEFQMANDVAKILDSIDFTKIDVIDERKPVTNETKSPANKPTKKEVGVTKKIPTPVDPPKTETKTETKPASKPKKSKTESPIPVSTKKFSRCKTIDQAFDQIRTEIANNMSPMGMSEPFSLQGMNGYKFTVGFDLDELVRKAIENNYEMTRAEARENIRNGIFKRLQEVADASVPTGTHAEVAENKMSSTIHRLSISVRILINGKKKVTLHDEFDDPEPTPEEAG